jgi:4-carboxymuconolactone decarboxylase
MGRLSEKEIELVAIGAAVGSNCIPCIVYHVGVAKKLGCADEEIREAVELADKIRKVPSDQVLNSAFALLGKAPDDSESCAPDCGCQES